MGIICRGDLHERLNFIYRLHLHPALPLFELEDSNTLDDDGGVDSCSEADEAEDVDESDGTKKHSDGTIMDPLGAGVVVIQGKVTRQSSTDSDRSRRNIETHPPKSENVTSEGIAESSEHFPTNCKDLTKVSDVVTSVSDIVTNVTDISNDRTTNTEDLTNVSNDLTKVSKPFESSASPSEESSEVWDGCSVESDNMGFDFIAENEFVDMDIGDNRAEMNGQQGTYHVAEGSDVTDGIKRNEIGRHSEEDGSSDGNMNQVSTTVKSIHLNTVECV